MPAKKRKAARKKTTTRAADPTAEDRIASCISAIADGWRTIESIAQQERARTIGE